MNGQVQPEGFEYDMAGTGGIDWADDSTAINATTIAEMRDLAGRYPQARSALIPMLHLVQSVDGRISPAGVRACVDILGVPEAQVVGVATFYTQFRRHRGGVHHVGVCRTALCAVLGGDQIMEALQEHLGIEDGQTTSDGALSLEAIECNAACDYAPVMMVDWEFMDNMTPGAAVRIVDELAAGHPVRSSRGPVLPGWRANERM
ncbi:MAG: NAD(P)H-dependent oxidoreductase subunit E, partial [Micrococcales bacterium]|nr:NAD(P)H-dependent oxidoreductase subunit E [Micrococcales bacterium]